MNKIRLLNVSKEEEEKEKGNGEFHPLSISTLPPTPKEWKVEVKKSKKWILKRKKKIKIQKEGRRNSKRGKRKGRGKSRG